MFSPNRLRIARKRRRLSSKELAELAELTSVTISRLEKFRNGPGDATVEKLAQVLKFPKEFFYGDDIDQVCKEAASFRSLTSMTAREREAALAASSLAYLMSDWIEKRFTLPEVALLDLGHEREPSTAARFLRQYWQLGEQPISNMIKLLESKGVRVFSLSENTKNVNAFSCWRTDIPYIFLNTFKSTEHSRFDAAHELGHLVLHKHGGPHQNREVEVEANSFAAEFLMPEADVRARIPYINSLDQIIVAKKRWGVSTVDLAYRLHKLGIVKDWQNRTFFIQINNRGFRSAEPDSLCREESVVWRKVLGQLWNERITKSHIAADLHIPEDEIENLIFGLVAISENSSEVYKNKPNLRICN